MPDRRWDHTPTDSRGRISEMMRRRLRAILLLTGEAAVAGYVTFLLIISGDWDVGRLINDAGRRRMLVHRVALDAGQMHEALGDRQQLRTDNLRSVEQIDASLNDVQAALDGAGSDASGAPAVLQALRPQYARMLGDALLVAGAEEPGADPSVAAASCRIMARRAAHQRHRRSGGGAGGAVAATVCRHPHLLHHRYGVVRAAAGDAALHDRVRPAEGVSKAGGGRMAKQRLTENTQPSEHMAGKSRKFPDRPDS